MSASANVSDLTDHLGFWLRYVSNHVSHAFAVKLAGKDVTAAEWVVLRALYGKDPNAAQPARERTRNDARRDHQAR